MEALLLIEDLYNFWWWDELDDVIDRLQNHDTIEITVETILKTLRWILELEDCAIIQLRVEVDFQWILCCIKLPLILRTLDYGKENN